MVIEFIFRNTNKSIIMYISFFLLGSHSDFVFFSLAWLEGLLGWIYESVYYILLPHILNRWRLRQAD